MSFVAISRFVVRTDHADEVARLLAERSRLVDSAPGFVRMQTLRGLEDAREFWLLTWWDSRDSFDTWHRSHTYKEAHTNIPKGLKLVPGSATLSRLEVLGD